MVATNSKTSDRSQVARMSSSCSWTHDMVDTLVRVYSEEMLKAGKAADNGSLTKQQWTSVVVIFNQETNANLSKQQIQSKMAEQKKYFQQVRELVDKSGFGFEDGKVTASDEAWDELIERRPELKRWRTTPFPCYDDLYNIYMGTIATGMFARGSLDRRINDDDNFTPLDNDYFNCDDDDSVAPLNNSLESSTDSSVVSNRQQGKRRRPTPPVPPKKRSNGEGMVSAMQRFASAFEDASKASLKIDHLSSAMTKAKKTETYVGASCGQKVKALQWVKDNAEIAHYMEDDDLNEFISELLSA